MSSSTRLERWLAAVVATPGLTSIRDLEEARRALLEDSLRGVEVVGGYEGPVIDVGSGGLLTDTVIRTLDDWVIEQRAALMLAGVLMFLAHPLLGVGPGGYENELERFGISQPSAVCVSLLHVG